jgi:hypothetical protein
MEFDLAGSRKCHPEIKLDGFVVFDADMEPGLHDDDFVRDA